MRQTILAKRYAKALFAVGKEEDKFTEYSRVLNDGAQLLEEVPEVMDGLTNPLYPLEVRAKVMEHLLKQIESDAVIKNFLNLVVQKKRADILPEIAGEFQTLVDADQNITRGTVIAATPLNDALQDKVKTTLEKITGKKVILSSQVDPALIGGIVAKVGDLVLDGSIRTQLTGLNESIKGSD